MTEFMRVIEKPWGQEELLEHNSRYVLKKLTMWAGHRCSIQYHELKQETVYVLSGELAVYVGTSVQTLAKRVLGPGDVLTLAPLEVHRMEAISDAVYLEASTPELEDVVRLEDDYNRS